MQALAHYELVTFAKNNRDEVSVRPRSDGRAVSAPCRHAKRRVQTLQVIYTCSARQCDNLRRSAMYACVVEQHFGAQGVAIFKDLLHFGRVPMGKCLARLQAQTDGWWSSFFYFSK